MKLTLKDNKILKDCFNGISNIIDEAILEFSTEGLKINAFDRSHVTFIEMNLKSDLFDEYECDETRQILIDTVIFDDILKRCNSNDTLELELDCRLKITFKAKTTRVFKMSLSYFEGDGIPHPKEKIPINFTIPSNFLKNSIKDIAAYSKTIRFIVNDTSLFVIGQNDNVKVKNRFDHDADVNGIHRSKFFTEKVNNILKSSNLNENCILALGDNKPIGVTFFIGESSYIRYLLAPVVEVDENY